MKIKMIAGAAALAESVAPGSSASAATFNLVATFAGNECGPQSGNGEFNPQNPCTINGSEWLARFETDPLPQVLDKLNALTFPTLDGSEIFIYPTGPGTFAFDYNNDGDDPAVTAFAAKGGPSYNLYMRDAGDTPFLGESCPGSSSCSRRGSRM